MEKWQNRLLRKGVYLKIRILRERHNVDLMIRPKKHLGQHFLADPNTARKIAGLISSPLLHTLEIGPGQGALTRRLMEKCGDFRVVEIDPEAAEFLRKNFHGLDLHEGDFLKTGEYLFDRTPMNITGNLPYNITSPVLFRVLENRACIREAVFMVQKEVAERLTEKPGSRAYGILSVLLACYFDLEYCFTVSEKVFIPPPKVKSAVIRLRRRKTVDPPCRYEDLLRVVKTAFGQRRKMLRNGLKSLITNPGQREKLAALNALERRPEQLSPAEFAAVTVALCG